MKIVTKLSLCALIAILSCNTISMSNPPAYATCEIEININDEAVIIPQEIPLIERVVNDLCIQYPHKVYLNLKKHPYLNAAVIVTLYALLRQDPTYQLCTLPAILSIGYVIENIL